MKTVWNKWLTITASHLTKLNKYVFGAFAIALFSVIYGHFFRCSFLPFFCKDTHSPPYYKTDYDCLTNLR